MDRISPKRDRVLSTIFGQLELLQEMAVEADEPALAQDLSAALANALFRYCDEKRHDLRAAIDAESKEIPRRAG